MRENLQKEDILEAFKLMEGISDCNVVEYMKLKAYGISPLKVLEYLKSVSKYNDEYYIDLQKAIKKTSEEEIRSEINDKTLDLYGFLDAETYFADEMYSGDYESGYELAAEFLLSEFCSNEQFTDYMDGILDEEETSYKNQKDCIREMREKILKEENIL